MRNLKTNEDLIKDLMNFSPYGGLCQAFIMQGIQAYCQDVINQKEEMLIHEEQLKIAGRIPLISTEAWIGIAEDVQKRCNEFYNR